MNNTCELYLWDITLVLMHNLLLFFTYRHTRFEKTIPDILELKVILNNYYISHWGKIHTRETDCSDCQRTAGNAITLLNDFYKITSVHFISHYPHTGCWMWKYTNKCQDTKETYKQYMTVSLQIYMALFSFFIVSICIIPCLTDFIISLLTWRVGCVLLCIHHNQWALFKKRVLIDKINYVMKTELHEINNTSLSLNIVVLSRKAVTTFYLWRKFNSPGDMIMSKNQLIDMGHFLNTTRDIRLFQNQYGNCQK